MEPMGNARHCRGRSFYFLGDFRVRLRFVLAQHLGNPEAQGHLLNLSNGADIAEKPLAFFRVFERQNGLKKLALFLLLHCSVCHIAAIFNTLSC